MPPKVNRVTVDLTPYPDLVVIYLGMRVNSLRGLKTVLQFGPRIDAAVASQPAGLLLHERLLFSLFPCTWACANTGAISNLSKPGRAPSASEMVAGLRARLRRRRLLALADFSAVPA
jgi:hypothetical protein